MIHDKVNYDIDKHRKGQYKIECQNCKEIGKTYKDKAMSINGDKQLCNCHRCGVSFFFGEIITNAQEVYKKPDIGNLTALKDEHLQKFSNRGITQKTVLKHGIKSAKGTWWAYPYYEGSEIVNVKYKSIDKETGKKKLYQAGGAKQTMYKYNDIINESKILICEGEEDALSWEESGIVWSCSVSQGAPNEKDKSIEKKLACVYNCFDIFENAEVIYLAGDNDPNGDRLNKELIKIFTPEKCRIIDYEDCNDGNEYHLKHGPEKLAGLIDKAKEVKVDGIFEADDFRNEILEGYRTGQPKGTTTYFRDIDNCWTHRQGEVTVWTGYNNEGKSLLLKQLLAIKSKHEDWKHAIFSPEEVPLSEFYTDIIESYVGKSADKDQEQYNNYMSEVQLNAGIQFVQKHFYTVYPEDDHSIDELLKKFSYLVRKKNIKTVTFDPYNQIHHKMKMGEREDLYISRFMAKLKKFAVDHMVCVHLVAHQTTPMVQKGENYPMPNIYKIKGGGTFGDKADNVIAVWREFRNTNQKDPSVKFISQKIKKQKLTGIPGTAIVVYNRQQNRYLYNMKSPFDLVQDEPVIELPIPNNKGLEPVDFDNYNPEEDEIPF